MLHDFLMFSNINGLEMIESLAADVGEVKGGTSPVFVKSEPSSRFDRRAHISRSLSKYN